MARKYCAHRKKQKKPSYIAFSGDPRRYFVHSTNVLYSSTKLLVLRGHWTVWSVIEADARAKYASKRHAFLSNRVQCTYVCANKHFPDVFKQSARHWLKDSLLGERQASTTATATGSVRGQKWKARSIPQTARGRRKFSYMRKDLLSKKWMLPLSFLLSPFPPKLARQTCTRIGCCNPFLIG